MYVSAEILTTIVSFAGLLAALAGGFGWMIHRTDAVERRLNARIDALEARLGARIDAFEARLGARIDELGRRVGGVEHELVRVQVAIARLEGPLPRLITARKA